MALRVSAAMALCLLFSLMAVTHCVPLEEAGDLATDASPAAVTAAADEEEDLLRFGVALEGEAPMEEDKEEEVAVNPVAEPDPDRSHPNSDGEELTALKPSVEGEQGDEKKEEQIDDDEDEDEEEKEKKRKKKNLDGGDKDEKEEKTKNKRKKHDCKEKKEKKTKKQNQSNGEEEEKTKTKKQIHRHHHVEKEKTKKNRPHHNSGNDSDDEDEQEEKARRWRKAISRRSRFGHGRRSQREESQTEEVKN